MAGEGPSAERLIARLLEDPAFREEFRKDPAGAARRAGLGDATAEMLSSADPLQTLELRESRSSLAGVMLAAAVEGVALSQLDVADAFGSGGGGSGATDPPIEPDPRGGGATGASDAVRELLNNDNVTFDANGIADVRAGRMDPRTVMLLDAIGREHRITISATMSDHSTLTAGGSVSNHHFGRAIDVASIDGKPVNAGNETARQLALALAHVDPALRPTEIGSPWQLQGPQYFTDADHQDHLHIAFDDPVPDDWKPPAVAPDAPPAQPAPEDAAQPGAPPAAEPGDAPDADHDAAQPAAIPADEPDTDDDTDEPDTDGSGREDGGSGDTEAEADDDDDEDDDGGDEDEDEDELEDEDEEDEDEPDEDEVGPDFDDLTDDERVGGGGQGGGDPDVDADSDAAAQAPAAGGDTDTDGGDADAAAAAEPWADPGVGIDSYPGDDAPPEQLAGWMATEARRRGIPPELPVMASLVESGLHNLSGGDADSVGFFQMRLGIWNQGPYAGYPDRTDLQLDWFLDQALAVKQQRIARGLPIDDPDHYGDWIADIERPAEQFRGRYQLRLEDARELLDSAGRSDGGREGAGGGDARVLQLRTITPEQARRAREGG